MNSTMGSSNGNVDVSIGGLPSDPPTECAGCKRTGLPLLVCDDCVPTENGSPIGNDWSKRRYVLLKHEQCNFDPNRCYLFD